jgi:MarR family transcriptional regulator, 2-MHQ and catechol-resistance regulon repressor
MAEPATDDDRITAFGMLLEAHAAVTAAVARDLEGSAMPVLWLEVLLRLARSPEQRLRMSDLAQEVQLSTSGLTRLVDRLEAQGLVARQACTIDRRGLYAALTEGGSAALRAVLPSHLESLERHVAEPLGGDLATLTDLLRRLRDHAGTPAPGPC